MKKKVAFVLLCVALLLPFGALANSWGLSGWLYGLTDDKDLYDEYSCLTDNLKKGSNSAQVIMHNRYHKLLICAELIGDETVNVQESTTALYQDDRKVKLTWQEDGFVLSYPKQQEEYIFLRKGTGRDARYFFIEGRMGNVLITWADVGYLLNEKGGSCLWTVPELSLDEFNVTLLPKCGEDVLRMNDNGAALGMFPLERQKVEGEKNGQKVAVYSAPDSSSYRAAKGKASLSKKESYGVLINKNGWQMVEYAVSRRTSRVGWIQTGAEGDNFGLVRLNFRTTCATYLTDDPYVSQFHQLELPADTLVTARGYLSNRSYAYVEVQGKNGLQGGFIPLAHLKKEESWQPHVAEELVGTWQMEGGGQVMPDIIDLQMDGDVGTYTTDEGHGTWMVVDLPENSGVSWNPSEYMICFWDDRGTAHRFALHMEKTEGVVTSLGMTWEEGGMGYVPCGTVVNEEVEDEPVNG